MTTQEHIAQIRSAMIDSRCLGKDAAVRVSIAEHVASEAMKKAEQLQRRSDVYRLRLMQLNARADSLQKKLSTYFGDLGGAH